MRRLSGIDADMLYGETPTWHMHVGGLVVIDGADGFGYDEIRRLLAAQTVAVPELCERVVAVPFGVDRPFWVRDGDFDLDAHLTRVRVAAPGGPAEVAAAASDLMSRKLDRRRPLWEICCLEGLAHDRVAILGKIHHAIADGVGGSVLMGRMFGLEPSPVPDEVSAPPPGERVPAGAELLARSVPTIATLPLRIGRAALRTAGATRSALARRGSPAAEGAAAPFHAPRTAFNRPVTDRRSFAFCSVPLAEVKAVKDAHDAKVNDVVLALCAGALRSWLEARGELPERPLVAAVPVSVRPDDQMGSLGNMVSGWFANLATDVDDPVRRLLGVRDAARAAKDVHDSGIEDVVMDWADLPAPAVWALGVRLYTASHLSERLPPIFNLLVSNVPGPPVPLYLGPARVVATYPFGPVLDTIGLNITALSSVDSVDFGIVGCPDLVPDLWELTHGIESALAELIKAV